MPVVLERPVPPLDKLKEAVRLCTQIKNLERRLESLFGPHKHSGIGIRDLSPRGSRYSFYECRLSKGIRLVFPALDASTLYFPMMGTHDDVQGLLRSFL